MNQTFLLFAIVNSLSPHLSLEPHRLWDCQSIVPLTTKFFVSSSDLPVCGSTNEYLTLTPWPREINGVSSPGGLPTSSATSIEEGSFCLTLDPSINLSQNTI